MRPGSPGVGMRSATSGLRVAWSSLENVLMRLAHSSLRLAHASLKLARPLIGLADVSLDARRRQAALWSLLASSRVFASSRFKSLRGTPLRTAPRDDRQSGR